MHLIFTCPETNRTFRSHHYSLQEGHRLVRTPEGQRELHGTVALTAPCPECGNNHLFQVHDIICPLEDSEV